ncbi:hypothetical protein BAE44_0019585 [Dichanthelium oligosanthes]|uniref:Uncharacterized protein n=1 Tax=Dichanthelium oligosanthes TaxID=888268 RepID=A0A1E5V2K5_9POAL|nr:hypothetical protein BAE44_0019585 [Dichanthelium oligosanthes]
MFLRVISHHEGLRVNQRRLWWCHSWRCSLRWRQQCLRPRLLLRRRLWWRRVCLGGWHMMMRRNRLWWWTGMDCTLRHRRCSRRRWGLWRLLSRSRFQVIRYRYDLERRCHGLWMCRLVLFLGLLFMFFVGATAATAEPDAAGDVAAGKVETWACRCHAK